MQGSEAFLFLVDDGKVLVVAESGSAQSLLTSSSNFPKVERFASEQRIGSLNKHQLRRELKRKLVPAMTEILDIFRDTSKDG